MLQRWLIYLLAAPAFIAACAGASDSTVFWQKDLQWEEGPPDLKYEVALGTLTAFRKSGKLVQINCELMRDTPTGPLMFNLKSGYSVFAGEWKRHSEHEIAVNIRLVAREKLATPIGQPTSLPGPVANEVWVLQGANTPIGASAIKTGKSELVQVPSLRNPADFEKLIQRYAKRRQ